MDMSQDIGSDLLQNASHMAQEMPRTSLENAQVNEFGIDLEKIQFKKYGGKNFAHLVKCTIGLGGLQLVWAVLYSYGTPYLLSLDFGKFLMAITWLAGPLFGTIVQPIVGICSDRCDSKFGRRKPFIIGGGIATIFSLNALAWTRKLTVNVAQRSGVDVTSEFTTTAIKLMGTFWVYTLNFSIQPLQGGLRALIVDQCTADQQDNASALAGLFVGLANVLGFLFGSLDLPHLTPFLGETHFQILSVISSVGLGLSIIFGCIFVKDDGQWLETPKKGRPLHWIRTLRSLLATTKTLPDQVRCVFEVQFYSWLGWFPFLYYITTFVGKTYISNKTAATYRWSHIDQGLQDEADRAGSLSLLIFAIVSLGASAGLPLVIRMISGGRSPSAKFVLRSFSKQSGNSSFSLRQVWTCSHLLFASCLMGCLIVSSTTTLYMLIGLIGFSWAATIWIPFALVGAEVAKAGDYDRQPKFIEEDFDQSPENHVGAILGLHNMAIAMPQLLAGLMSSVIFWAAEKIAGPSEHWSISILFLIGSLAALVATYKASRLGCDSL